MNKARALMNMPQEACLASDDEEVNPPAVKRAKTGKLVEGAMLGESLRAVPPQVVFGWNKIKLVAPHTFASVFFTLPYRSPFNYIRV